MLCELYIRNIAIIDELTVRFGPGLNILSGETGAGKSVLIQSLNVMMGTKPPADVIRTGEAEAVVSARFDLRDASSHLQELIRQHGIEMEDELLIKRVLSREGRHRAYINGEPAQQGWLREMAPYLVDISSQHDQHLLRDADAHVDILDNFGELEKEKESYVGRLKDYATAKRELDELQRRRESAAHEMEFIRFQLNELEKAELKAGEEDELVRERERAKHASKLMESVGKSVGALREDQRSVVDCLHAIHHDLVMAEQYDEKLVQWAKHIEESRIVLDEMGRDMADYLESVPGDPDHLEKIEKRLYVLYSIKKKYGGSIEAAMARRDTITRELALLEDIEGNLDDYQKRVDRALAAVEESWKVLSQSRRSAAVQLKRQLEKALADIGMSKTVFEVVFTELEQFELCGKERTTFMISANVGEKPGPLAKIASGGELSRVMLAIKEVLVGDQTNLASMFVFDEIDAGVGGAVAEMIGKKLKTMAKRHQVMCITHLPQVAVYADHHFGISKRVVDKRTSTHIDPLDQLGRVEEIARMLGGVTITESTRSYAREMLGLSHAG